MSGEIERGEKEKDNRLHSPFSETTIIHREIPTVAGITDTHYQRNLHAKLGVNAISTGKGNFLGLGFIPALRTRYREIAQVTNIALHAMRPAIEKAVEKADMFIHGGDVSDSLTLQGIVGDLAFQEEYLGRRFDRGNAKSSGFLGTLVMNGNHDAGFNILRPDFLLRYPDIWLRFRQIPLQVYEKIIDFIEQGGAMQDLASKLHINDKDTMRFAMHPALKWFLERTYFGPAIGLIVDSKANTQVAFLDSEIDTNESSITALETSLIRDLSLHTRNPKLMQKIVALRQNEKENQDKVIKQVLSTCESIRTTVYSHNPHEMQAVLIEEAQKQLHISPEQATMLVQSHIAIIGGHWHTNDDKSSEKWNKDGVAWWNGPSRIKTMWSMYTPLGSTEKPPTGEFANGDYVSVLTGSAIDPKKEVVSAAEINREKRRLRSLVSGNT